MIVYIVYYCEDRDNLKYFLQHAYTVTPDRVYIFTRSTRDIIPRTAIYYPSPHSYCFDNWTAAITEYGLLERITEDDRVVFID